MLYIGNVLARGRLSFQSRTPGLSLYKTVFGKVFRISMAVGAAVVLIAGLIGRTVMLVEQAKDRSVFAVVSGKLSLCYVLRATRRVLDQVVLWKGVSCAERGGGASCNSGSAVGNLVCGQLAQGQTA